MQARPTERWTVAALARAAEPIHWPELRPADVDDPAVLTRCYDEVVRVMQRMLDRLSEGRRPWLGKPS